MKHLYCLAFFLSITFGFSQCPPEDVTLSSQADVDSFNLDYPECSDFANVNIVGSDIVDLTPLSQIQSIGYLAIQNTMLTTLDGLHNLTNLDGNPSTSFFIDNNSNLSSLQALSNLTDSQGIDIFQISNNPQLESLEGLEWLENPLELFIFNNDSLEDLTGLSALQSLEFLSLVDNDNVTSFNGINTGAIFYSGINIVNNDSLIQLSGLEEVSILSGIIVNDNANLLNLSGIENIENSFSFVSIENNPLLNDISQLNSIGTLGSIDYFELSVFGNPNLTTCDIDILCEFLASSYDPNSQFFTINSNGASCNSINDILLSCQTVPVNDNCENAQLISISETVQSYNQFGSESTSLPTCNNDGELIDVWFRFNSGDLETVNISVDTGFNIQLWEGDCDNLIPIDNACSADSLNDISVEIETDYIIQVWSVETGLGRRDSGVFNLTVQDQTLSLSDAVKQDFKIFPNPASGNINFTATSQIDEILIFNALGQQVKALFPENMSGYFNVSGFNKGLYFLKLKIDNRVNTAKFIVN
ncbi:T9SS type A sorting domain-containing protein [Psychroserpens sp.]|uniref:T9SS type A sorting domain-containing protein n=1 Tax=Psychroserpens sp. TaxID=2020870 RepID=UPI003C727E21